jgi:hypothetical protein
MTAKVPPKATPSKAAAPPAGKPQFKRYGPKAVGTFVPGLTRKAFEKYGFSAAALITDWAAIVGRDLAAYTSPERLKWPKGVDAYQETASDARGRPGATLVLRVDAARALEVQYKTQQIIERINAYFGYRAVSDIRLLQAALERPAPRKRPPLQPKDAVSLPTIADEGLRAALEKLGAGIKARNRKS